jgi:hypothetical protein
LPRSRRAKLQRIIDRHLVELIPIYVDHDPRRLPYSYFLDVSVLRGDYSALLQPDLLTWHLKTSEYSRDLSARHGRRLIRRVFPIPRRTYLDQEIRLIKYNLHFQLALGFELLVMIVDPDFLPEDEFGTDNFVLAKRGVRITSVRPYDEQVPPDIVVTPGSDSEVSDLYLYLESLNKEDRARRLAYNERTFTAYRLSDLKRRYGWLLYALQSGRCALSGQSLDLADWDVDHIFPQGMGGNNSLVNLQAARHIPNVQKGARIEDPTYCLSPEELLRYGLSTTYHRRLSDRHLVGIPLGPDAIDYLNIRSL